MFYKAFRSSLIGGVFLLFIFSFASGHSLATNPEDIEKESRIANLKPHYLTFENAEVRITGPSGWYVFRPKNEGKFGVHIRFSLYPVGSTEEDYPTILLTTSQVKQEAGKTPLEYANYLVGVIKTMGVKDNATIVEEPISVNINSQEGARYAYETNTFKGKRLKILEYVFTKGNLRYSLGFGCKLEYFDKHTKEFEGALNTFVLK